jgi:hypothetical protein
MDSRLQSEYRARQEEAMIEQFAAGQSPDQSEHDSWRRIRRAAVRRSLKKAAR